MAVVVLAGFSSGLPLALTGVSLQAWLTGQGFDLKLIGTFAAVGLPYTLKFLWSPLMDRFVPPFLGRRRGWMLLSQLAMIGGTVAMAACGVQSLWLLGVLATAVAFFSASQDIVIDAYRTELLKPEELGAGASLSILGYRIGMIFSGAMALILADHMSWQAVYLIMAGGMLVGLATTLLAPEPDVEVQAPRTLAQAVVLPLREFLSRRGAIEILLFILIYKLDWAMVQAFMAPFLIKTGFSYTEIGLVTNGLGVAATVGGAIVGGAVITGMGIHRSLWIFGLLQGLAGLSFTILATLGKNHSMMVAAITVENACSGMATAAFTGFIMSLCNKRFTATQYALLSSLMALPRVMIGLPAGWLAERIGWPQYFIVATVIAVPGLLLLLRYPHWQVTASDALASDEPGSEQEPPALSQSA